MDYTAHYISPIGDITIASDGHALLGLWFEGQRHFAEVLDDDHKDCHDLPIFDETRRWLDIYFDGMVPPFTPPLVMRTTDFRKSVWQQLLTIPCGHTMTYGEIARQIGNDRTVSPRAVGGAVGHNAISLIIPCHRVVGSHGSLTGYAGGIDRKAWLLRWEDAMQ